MCQRMPLHCLDTSSPVPKPFEIVQILLEQTATLWRDFVVTGLSTATEAALQICGIGCRQHDWHSGPTSCDINGVGAENWLGTCH
jgi:hypothetical protein